MARRIVVALVLLLVGGAGGFALGRFTHLGDRHAEVDAQVEILVKRAESALVAERFDEPEGDNVLDLTDDILAKKPDEPRARSIRQRASDRLVRLGLQRRATGDLAGALRWFELAARMTRPDHGLTEVIAATKRDLAAKK